MNGSYPNTILNKFENLPAYLKLEMDSLAQFLLYQCPKEQLHTAIAIAYSTLGKKLAFEKNAEIATDYLFYLLGDAFNQVKVTHPLEIN